MRRGCAGWQICAAVAPEEPASLAADAGAVVDVPGIYQRYRAGGVQLGPRFQALQGAWARDTVGLGKIALAPALVSGAGAYHLHPVLLDAALQVMGAVFADRPESDLYLPVADGSISVLRSRRHKRLEPRSRGADSRQR